MVAGGQASDGRQHPAEAQGELLQVLLGDLVDPLDPSDDVESEDPLSLLVHADRAVIDGCTHDRFEVVANVGQGDGRDGAVSCVHGKSLLQCC
ncbi:MAG: hypothetical protein COY70_00160 [Candidatus Magasanikbacteria bacterium CG_4_10_14_0_8_um_filter_42_12]|nr:MAG: hypothetical protein COY70_00160 [Candidatus Magasanikbacteria bacterium CG_4_10_14_0_8_um_filter_42_12]